MTAAESVEPSDSAVGHAKKRRRTISNENANPPATDFDGAIHADEQRRQGVDKPWEDRPMIARWDEYAFVTLAKANTSALSFGPALQEVVQNGFDGLFMKPEKLTDRVSELSGRLQRAAAKPARVERVRSAIYVELRVRMTKLLSFLTAKEGDSGSIVTPSCSTNATPRSQDRCQSSESPSPVIQPYSVKSAGEAQGQNGRFKASNGKLKRIKRSFGPAMNGVEERDKGRHLETAHISISRCFLKRPLDFANEYWSQPTKLPFGTRNVPLKDVPLLEIEAACSRAFGANVSLEIIRSWEPTLFVAMFTTWARAEASFYTEIRVRDIAFRSRYLPRSSPRTFPARVSTGEHEPLDRITETILEYFQAKVAWNVPQLRIQRHYLDERLGYKLIAYFDSIPSIVEMHIPTKCASDAEPMMMTLLPRDLGQPCWVCDVRRGQARCEKAEMVAKAPPKRSKRRIREAAIAAVKVKGATS
ncbi:hypothetical protein DOTSEDRAFT_83961 [Dothistroma septosporum NZE10]|uniref:Uncharacterized protein n=1 Tax=Dothistroma septosporum (strain NZE10 / CBS 128990) TaxID=675120 RepID=M2YI00_DOTSN|nr:hypothetical protein DOTSEDRAFT_83961 [Dothistroma septosporum NZE10]